MGDFFHGWQRKLGCITLLMALASCFAWIRSYTNISSIRANGDGIEWVIISSFKGSVSVLGEKILKCKMYPLEWGSNDKTVINILESGETAEGLKLRFNWIGFGHGEYFQTLFKNRTVGVWVIPYWSIVLPLTLLSTWLLLSKPRKPTEKRSEPSVATGS